MKPVRKQRLIRISLIFCVALIGIGLLLYAMRGDLNHYYSLDQISQGKAPVEQQGIRVGGMVEKGSIQREGESLTVQFAITDFKHKPLTIRYTGILPELFAENQGVIARGILNKNGVFQADQILAKHDENYLPPEVKADMERSGFDHSKGRKP
ncbi:cytochrome c maturation protein CcmE [Suttonella ornithocola]|uniref:Cytochrome c-type biogenesis protein CcmE n=1 Tax=Suttonella ornithocola TaxID=279832 RepID=A0A380MV28_9GAMM|nr:cytochrome c maturation protein CcmE [Suttonella ornithocola]SUO96415.1 Heme chaperone CcmE [Suttonella ornithocola]